MNTKTFTLALCMVGMVLLAAAGCARKKPNVVDDATVAPYTVLADNPDAKISEVMQKLRGRWVKELKDQYRADPGMIRLFATSDNTLTGRFLFAGAFDDTGVAATLVQAGDLFTL